MIVEAALVGSFGDAQAGFAQQPRGSGQAGLGQELAGGEIEETVDEPGKPGGRQSRPPGQAGKGDGLRQVAGLQPGTQSSHCADFHSHA